MTEDRIENLLRQADRTAGRPAPVSVKLSVVRRRACRRRVAAAAASAAAVLLIALGIWPHFAGTPETTHNRPELVKLEDQVRQLQATTDATLSLVREVIDREKKQRKLDELQAQLAAITDPREEIRKQIDKTAFTLVYQADRLYYELSRTDSAVEAYNQVIMYFPKNQWADVARQRLDDIKKKLNSETSI